MMRFERDKSIVGTIVIASGRTGLLSGLKRIFSCAEIKIQARGQQAKHDWPHCQLFFS
jgi:hypothetical protein